MQTVNSIPHYNTIVSLKSYKKHLKYKSGLMEFKENKMYPVL